MTRPEPTIYGNCDSWDFIVGKKPGTTSPKIAIFLSLQGSNRKLMHNLFTIFDCSVLDNLWVIGEQAPSIRNNASDAGIAPADIAKYRKRMKPF